MTAVSSEDYRNICEFLFQEARLLDRGDYRDWLALLAPDIRYRLVNMSVLPAQDRSTQAAREVVLMDEDRYSLSARVTQLSTPALTIAENPRSSMRRFVNNVLVAERTDALFEVESSVLIYHSRPSFSAPALISLGRTDLLKRTPEGLRLVRRDACLDEAVVGVRSLASIF